MFASRSRTLATSRFYSTCNPSAAFPPQQAAKPTTSAAKSQQGFRLSHPKPKLAGSLALRRASLHAHASSARKPQSAAAAPAAASSSSAAAAHLMNENAFRPVELYPLQLALHQSFTPSHMPLPVNLGTQRYKSALYTPPAAAANPFAPAAPVDPSPSVRKVVTDKAANNSGFAHHLSLTRLLDTPSQSHHLGLSSPSPLSAVAVPVSDIEVDFPKLMAHVSRPAEQAWENVLAKMDAVTQPASEMSSESKISEAVDEVNMLLAQMEVDEAAGQRRRVRMEIRERGRKAAVRSRRSTVGLSRLPVELQNENEVSLDSVQRKRRKKISKHKYKKRRKATRAERKRLGK